MTSSQYTHTDRVLWTHFAFYLAEIDFHLKQHAITHFKTNVHYIRKSTWTSNTFLIPFQQKGHRQIKSARSTWSVQIFRVISIIHCFALCTCWFLKALSRKTTVTGNIEAFNYTVHSGKWNTSPSRYHLEFHVRIKQQIVSLLCNCMEQVDYKLLHVIQTSVLYKHNCILMSSKIKFKAMHGGKYYITSQVCGDTM